MIRDEIEKFQTDEGRAEVKQFIAEALAEEETGFLPGAMPSEQPQGDGVPWDEVRKLYGLPPEADPTETGAGEAGGRDQHPDDAAVTEVRAWLDGLDDEALVEFKVRRLRSVLKLLDGWERNARAAAAQRNAAEGRLDTTKVDMRLLREDVAAATARAEKAEAEARRLRAELKHCADLNRDLVNESADAQEALGELRGRIALALERTSNQHDQDAERYADERSPLLKAKAEALWDAARMVRDGEEGDGDA